VQRKLQSNHHHQQTNIQLFTGRMPFLSPNQQCQSTEGKISHPWTCLPQAHLWVFQLCLWPLIAAGYLGGSAMPLTSPLMPVPQRRWCFCSWNISDSRTPLTAPCLGPRNTRIYGGGRNACIGPQTSRKIFCVCIPTVEIDPTRVNQSRELFNSRVSGVFVSRWAARDMLPDRKVIKHATIPAR